MRSSLVVKIVAAFVVAVVLGACTRDEPPPDPEPEPEESAPEADAIGRQVAVVLPPPDRADAAVLESMRQQLTGSAELLRGVDHVRPVIPESSTFVEDLVISFAEQGHDVVCVVGPTSTARLRDLAGRYPDVGFCTIDAAPAGGLEVDADAVGALRRAVLRTDELGHVVGTAARADAGTEGTVGLVLDSSATGDDGFRAGLVAGLGDIDVIEAEVPSGSDPSMTDRLEAVLAAGATHVVVDHAPGAQAAVEAVQARAVLLAPEELVREAGLDREATDDETSVLLTWSTRWARPLAGPAGSLGDDGTRVRSLGVNAIGPLGFGPQVPESLRAQVRVVTDLLRRGERDPLEPVLTPRPDPEDEPDADDTDDGGSDQDDDTDDPDDPDAEDAEDAEADPGDGDPEVEEVDPVES